MSDYHNVTFKTLDELDQFLKELKGMGIDLEKATLQSNHVFRFECDLNEQSASGTFNVRFHVVTADWYTVDD